MTSAGEEKAWQILKNSAPSVICKNAAVLYDQNRKQYSIQSFGIDFRIDPLGKTILSDFQYGEEIIQQYGYFLIHSFLWYLINAKDIPLSGRLIKPEDLKGGELFFRGSHILPLEKLAQRYAEDRKGFLHKGRELCGEVLQLGDASFRIMPMPRIPVVLLLWLKDEEFPARADILLDSSCEIQLPLDIIWSIAMVSVMVLI